MLHLLNHHFIMAFYLELSSEAGTYASNNASSFRTIINPTKKLKKEEWEVALTEIKLPPYRNFGPETIQTVIGSTKRNYTVELELYSDSEQLLDGIRALRIPVSYTHLTLPTKA